MNFQYEHVAPGFVYYKNIIKDPELIIKKIENLEVKRKEMLNYFSEHVKPWVAWDYGDEKNKTVFCWQKFIPKPEDINKSDIFYNDQLEISQALFGSLESGLNHYFELYPYAKKNIKSREKTMHILKYEKSGHLPAHSDHGISSRVLSALLYLNDDYVGGEITFPHIGFSKKPEAGSLIFFPANYVFVHEVNAVTEGTRYALPNWYHNRLVPYYSDGTE